MMVSSEIVRLGVNLNHETADVIRERKARGHSATETVHKAIALLDFLYEETKRGRTIRVVNKHGEPIKILVLS